MADSLKQKTFKGMVWRSGESFITYGVSFVVGIILARILNPADFGLIAMVEVFTVIASRFADSGFTNALIRKNNRKDIDYSTVYVTNVVISTVFALILFFVATPIANFYNQPLLQKIVRFNALMVFLGSFLAVQSARLTIQLDFKTR
ncbi:MAG: oligosaccharide flippase family protein, partial [Bacteroidota bacterium]|nr:oligosaccharide flippase family protein [Bacteroidota bacterium]